jgi:hypothetical protein
MTGPLVVPLGRYLGLLPVDRPTGRTLAHVVRVSGRRVELSDDDHLVWALAHGVPSAPDLTAWTRAAMRRNLPQRAADLGLDEALDRLRDAGLLTEVDGSEVGFARSVRLLPQAQGLGNRTPESRMFDIGYPGVPLVSAPTEVFFIWSWGGTEPDLFTACERATAQALPYGTGNPADLVTIVVASLHILLAANVACVDTALAVPA